MSERNIREAYRGDHINLFIQVAMEEGIIDIKLKNGPRGSPRYNKENSDYDHLGYWRKTVNIVEALNFNISFCYQTGLKALNKTIRTQLRLINPSTTDRMFLGRERGEILGIIRCKGLELNLHGLRPTRGKGGLCVKGRLSNG